MRDEPGGADLLRAAREALADDVLPALQGEQRYAALMAVNALGIVERELAEGERLRAADGAVAAFAGNDRAAGPLALSEAIRSGRHDRDERLHAALYARAVRAVAITRPGALTTADRRQGDQ